MITLENRALMNTRLRVLYADGACVPFLAETDRVLFTRTEKVTLPADAKNVKITVEKEVFVNVWRSVYNGTLNGQSSCIRITGITLKSGVSQCS